VKVGIVGCGRLGSALARALGRRRGSLVLGGVLSRHRSAAGKLLRVCGRGIAFAGPAEMLAACDTIVLCVPDPAIAESARSLVRAGARARHVVLHCSGARGPAPLRPLERRGVATGTLHPLAAFPPAGSRSPFPEGIGFCVAGDRRARAAAGRLARALKGGSFTIPDRARPAYHLAASLLANDTTVIAALAESILAGAVKGRERELRGAMSRLLESVAAGIRENGPAKALTGPAARADAATLRRQMSLLKGRGPLRRIHGLLSLEALRIAAELGRVPERRLAAARKVVRASARGRR